MIQILKKYFYLFKYRKKKIKIGRKCIIGGLSSVFEGYNCIGDNTLFSGLVGFGSYIGKRCTMENVKIGKYCSIANDVKLVVGNHPTRDFVSTHPAFFSTNKQAGFTFVERTRFEEFSYADEKHFLIIGNDVWIGADAILLSGITIGDGAIIAAGAVVTKDVLPYTIVTGVPARMLRKRFEDEQIEKLLKIKWWDKEQLWIQKYVSSFSKIDCFIEEVENENSDSTSRV